MTQYTIEDIYQILFHDGEIQVNEEQRTNVEKCYHFLEEFARDKVIYGINTGFGPMAQWRIEDSHLHELQYNIIRSHSTGAGQALGETDVRAAMIARLCSILQAKSGVHPELVTLLEAMINNHITPFVPEHGSVGASGDLVQLAHIALCLIGEGEVLYQGKWQKTREVMDKLGLKPLQIHIREGLSCTNGTSVMTGLSIVNQYYAEQLLHLATMASVWMNEVAGSFDDLMSEPLNEARPHPGQIEIARQMREISAGSQCLKKREHDLYDNGHQSEKVFDHKVQPYYSLRCIPQILGPVYETMKGVRTVIEDELRSASDNPIVDPVTKNVYHGGNFHGDYISLEEDKLKIAVTRLVMTAERQLNYLMHDRINGILPPFLNIGTLGLNYGMQACQFTATSTTAECQTLSMPNYVHSIPNNNDNQDIVSMGTNTALITRRVIENGYQVMAILYMALAQATDCLNIKDQLSRTTKAQYHSIRLMTPTIKEDTPKYEDIANIITWMKGGKG